ncbi:MAG: cytochrome c [Acidobacteriia bacterium]|nr:cytochrome c [Terriglobia bacterium]
MKRSLLRVMSLFAFLLLVGGVAAFQFNLSALPEPGRMETLLAAKGKRFLIRRASRGVVPPPPTDRNASLTAGDKLFGTECSECHGYSGRKPTDAGRWMYPRAADLGSAEVQGYSDRELFWIVKNGIRLSGMPAFGRVESDKQIWDLVHFVRTLPANANPKGERDSSLHSE